jgi:hypothetical protein
LKLFLIILVITLISIFSIITLVFWIIKRNLNSSERYQLYWTTQKNLFSIYFFKGQFTIKSENLELAKKIGMKMLQEKYQRKAWFNDIKFTVRGGGKQNLSSPVKWEMLRDVLDKKTN